jgi:hypothetical protein
MSGIMNLLLGAVPQVVPDPYFEYTTLLLPGNGTNGAQNNTFLDSSTNAFSITRNGNTTQGTFSPFSQTGWGNYFDGSGDYLTATNSTNLNPGTGDFTLECWVYATAAVTSLSVYEGSQNGIVIGFDGSSQLAVAQSNVAYLLNDTTAFTLNQWVHIAVARSGTTLSLFKNGSRVATATNSTNFATSSENRIGRSAGTAYFTGYISNLRLVKGTAVYDPSQSTLTVPTAPLTAITNTSLLTCQSNRFVDNSTNAFAITRNGDVSVQAFSPFNPTAAWSASTNGGSGYFDGSGDYLTVGTSTAFSFGTSDFTIEFWTYKTSSANGVIVDGRVAATATPWSIAINGSAFPLFYDGATEHTSSIAVTLNAWNHVAIARSSGTLKIFVNGVQGFSSTVTTNLDRTAGLVIGARAAVFDNLYLGYLSGLRIVKGTAVYTAAFTPPTAPLTAITNTSLLLNYTNAGIYDATSKNDLETVGNAQISTTQSKFGGSSMYFDGTDDRLPAPASVDIAIGTADFTIEGWFYTASPATNRGLFQISTTAGGLEAGNANNLAVYCSSSVLGVYYANTFKAGTTSISANTWTHFALVRTGGSTKLYVNGTADSGFGTNADTQNYTGKNVCVGGYFSTSFLWNGYIDDFRITRGIARYTANFTAPTAAFPLL